MPGKRAHHTRPVRPGGTPALRLGGLGANVPPGHDLLGHLIPTDESVGYWQMSRRNKKPTPESTPGPSPQERGVSSLLLRRRVWENARVN